MNDTWRAEGARPRTAIVGGGSFGAVLGEYMDETGTREVVGFLDDDMATDRRIGAAFDPDAVEALAVDSVCISIGTGATREQLSNAYRSAGITIDTFVHPAVALPRTVSVGPGSVLLPGCQIMPFATIGDGVFVSTGAAIAHHTVVGAFTSLASGARLGAGIEVGSRVSFGVASSVMTGVHRVGDDARIGAGAVVIADVEPGSTVVGVPARSLTDRKKDGA